MTFRIKTQGAVRVIDLNNMRDKEMKRVKDEFESIRNKIPMFKNEEARVLIS